ncbi:MAG: hypothetical protein Q9160_001706 [Pyrenula sp. 1 TL-2023]
MLRLLGEGGFSYVYLVQDTNDSALYALKKIRCPFGQESVSQALKEVEAYTLFSPESNIIHSVDYSVQDDKGAKVSGIGDTGAGSKTVYILLPYYRRGNLQDAINANLVNHTKFPEKRLMILMLGVAQALKAMHQYKKKGGAIAQKSRGKAKAIRDEAAEADQQAANEVAQSSKKKKSRSRREMVAEPPDDEDVENQPLMENEVIQSQEGVGEGELRAYAHRDIKPGNIMIDDDGITPILMDLGSLAASPIPVTSRSLALAIQDTAAEHSTMPYRAPELFDVKTGSVIDTKVDIWSLGCTMYACLVGKSPFEARSDETGGSLSICVLSGDWRFPDEGNKGKKQQQPSESSDSGIREPVRDVVRRCLQVEPADRPDIDELITLVQKVIVDLPDDEDGIQA